MSIWRVYIITNKKNWTLYIWVTNDLLRRTQEHKDTSNKSFSEKYNLDILVYYEKYDHIRDAITREKQLKKWNRERRVKLIESINSEWTDLAYQL